MFSLKLSESACYLYPSLNDGRPCPTFDLEHCLDPMYPPRCPVKKVEPSSPVCYRWQCVSSLCIDMLLLHLMADFNLKLGSFDGHEPIFSGPGRAGLLYMWPGLYYEPGWPSLARGLARPVEQYEPSP